LDAAAERLRGSLPRSIIKRLADARQGMLKHGGSIKVERALLVPLALVGDVIHPNRGDAQVLYGQEAIAANDAFEILSEAEQARIGLAQGIEVGRIEVMIQAIEIKATP